MQVIEILKYIKVKSTLKYYLYFKMLRYFYPKINIKSTNFNLKMIKTHVFGCYDEFQVHCGAKTRSTDFRQTFHHLPNSQDNLTIFE